LIVVIRDNGYEGWGDCGGQTWCHSCHISIDRDTKDAIFLRWRAWGQPAI